MNRKDIFRIGDKVTLADGFMPIKRVGYPMHWTEVSLWDGDDTCKAMYELYQRLPMMSAKLQREFYKSFCKYIVEHNGFGGRTRSVHRYETWEQLSDLGHHCDMKGKGVFEVVGKRTAKTGEYWPGYRSYEGEYDPAYLCDEKTVIILDVLAFGDHSFLLDRYEVLSTDCTKLESEQK